ncbi:hypothetical protein A9Z40_01850 [Microbacterium arborescens]|uniref:Uncharacterized protein n=1 Tax=Microbacterium arborescens TaxID=33883 RepID=A0ABX2WJD9_9MICO|nr:hypothetical protein [Microbacterium arborescens]OAZ41445.1 hypothetical protein A9Z40_01850 [Microbacterium arborescens]
MSPDERASAWALTRSLSVRETVRAAASTASGEVLNDYDRDWSVNELPPSTTWAMYLSGDRRAFDYLCFDLDSSRGNAPYDAGKLALWLEELNIPHLLCESGPNGGRHVWIGMAEAVDAGTVRTVAQLASQLLPSLDPTPLLNPATGCVRPPGAPHRLGGASTARGPLSALLHLPVPSEAIAALATFLLDVGAELPPANLAPLRGMAIDDDGHPYITGRRRDLSPRIAQLVDAPVTGDASYTLATVLAGCAHARWRYTDVLALINTPAFEHVRTLRSKGAAQERTPRTAAGRIRTLNSAWSNAVRYVASHPINGSGDDLDYLDRLTRALTAVERAQERADAMPGLWGADRASSAARHRTGTHSTRAVLDALCLYIAQSAQLTVEADIRRLSADTGYGRTTVHTALQALARPLIHGDPESAWIVRVGEPEGHHGQRYRLSVKFSTEPQDQNRTQVLARPAAGQHQTHRSYWTQLLTRNLEPFRHDTFAAPHSLGRTSALIYQQLHTDAIATLPELSTRTRLDARRTRKALRRLAHHGLVERTGTGWIRAATGSLDQAAEDLDVAGYLEQRRAAYGNERARWEWWNAELTWMRKPNKKRRGRRSTTGLTLFAQNDRPDYARYPRGPDGRGNHREALRLVEAGILAPAATLTAA